VEVAAPSENDELLAMNEALDKLFTNHPVRSEVVKPRYFVGMTNVEATRVLASQSVLSRIIRRARVWLFREIKAAPRRIGSAPGRF
jgi:hypothetical protein